MIQKRNSIPVRTFSSIFFSLQVVECYLFGRKGHTKEIKEVKFKNVVGQFKVQAEYSRDSHLHSCALLHACITFFFFFYIL